VVAELVVVRTQTSSFKGVMVRGGFREISGRVSGAAEHSGLLHCDAVLTGKYRHVWRDEVSQYSK
jgi:hypothetical protein